jgi:hypothetical protein
MHGERRRRGDTINKIESIVLLVHREHSPFLLGRNSFLGISVSAPIVSVKIKQMKQMEHVKKKEMKQMKQMKHVKKKRNSII